MQDAGYLILNTEYCFMPSDSIQNQTVLVTSGSNREFLERYARAVPDLGLYDELLGCGCGAAS